MYGLGGGWSLNGEFAYQWGKQDPSFALRDSQKQFVPDSSRDIAAWGGYAKVKKTFTPSWKPSISLGYVGLSGDDPTTSKNEGWDPLFSRWPKWSELFVMTQVNEKGVSYWTNTALWELEFRCSPTTFLDLRATYYKMAAYQASVIGAKVPGSAVPGALMGTGKNRGDLWQARGDFRIGPAVKGHLVYERLTPGDFYTGKDPAFFLRFEIGYTFKAKF